MCQARRHTPVCVLSSRIAQTQFPDSLLYPIKPRLNRLIAAILNCDYSQVIPSQCLAVFFN